MALHLLYQMEITITMMTFSYQARDASGKIVSGIQDALNEDNAVTSLMSRGLMVLSLQKKAAVTKSRNKSLDGQGNRSRSLYPAAFDHDRGRHFARPGDDRALRPMRPEAAEAICATSSATSRARAGRRNFQRIDRETSARFRSALREHGESG